MKCSQFCGSSKKTQLETFLDFSFFLCISPFRISRDDKIFPNETKIIQYKLQKVLAGLFAIFDLFGSITRIRLNLDKNLDNPVGYFNFLWSISVTLMHVAFYFVLWTKQHDVLRAVDMFRKSFSNGCTTTRLLCNQFIGFALCIISLVLGLLPSLRASHLLPPDLQTVSWNPCLVIRTHVVHSNFMFFLSNNSSLAQNSSYIIQQGESLGNLCDLDKLQVAQGIGHIVIYTARYMGAYFVDLFMIIMSVTIWIAVNKFVHESTRVYKHEFLELQRLEISPTVSSVTHGIPGCDGEGLIEINSVDTRGQRDEPFINSAMVSKYSDLKSLAINAAMGPILFCYVFEAIFYYAINLNSIFTARDWHARIQVAHFLFGAFTVLGFSADVTRQMDGFKLWLVNGNATRKSISSDLLVGLIHETQSKTIAVSACGIFTVDYPLIFNIVTTTVTFFLIVVQLVPTAC